MASSISAKFNADFWAFLQANPQAQVAAIARCERLDDEIVSAAVAAGLVVRRRLRLIKGLAIEGCASAVLAFAESPRVRSVEPDQPVHTMR